MATTIGTIRQIETQFVASESKMFSYKNLYQAYKKCRKNKRNTLNQLNFEIDLGYNLLLLQEELENKTYRPSKYICFLASSPKLREVFAANFRDRVVHHLLLEQIENFYEKKFIADVYNNRKNKGTHKAVQKAKNIMQKNKNGYYLQLDIKGFFYHLNKNILFKTIFEDISKSDMKNKEKILWLANIIIYHNPCKNFHFKGNIKALYNLPEHKTLLKRPKYIGLPIGNITSQFFANVYLYRFDNFIKKNLACENYLRYVDDFVIFHKDKEFLIYIKENIQNYLFSNLGLSLRTDSKLRQNKAGLDFLGYIIKPSYTLVRKRVVNNYKYKKAKFLDKYEEQKGKMSLEEIKYFLSVQASFMAHIKWANAFKLQKQIGEIDEEKYISKFNTSWT